MFFPAPQLHVYDIINQSCFFLISVEYLPDDGRNMQQACCVIICIYIYRCIELMCICWNRQDSPVLQARGPWGEQGYSSTLSRTMAHQIGVGGSAPRPGRTLPHEKTRYPFYRRLGGPQGRSGWAENLVHTRIRSLTVQPVAQSLYRLSYPVHSCWNKHHKI